MPELPEVETIRRELAPRLVGRTFGEAWAFPHPKFTAALDAAGATVSYLARRGKYLLMGLGNGPHGHAADGTSDGKRELVVHLGMTGSLLLCSSLDRPDATDASIRPSHVRAWWELRPTSVPDSVHGPREWLVFRDARRFGRIAVVDNGNYRGSLAAQGPDALDPTVTAEEFWKALRRSRRAVKTQLLSQRPLAGIGNIYADEALWLAGIYPRRRRVTRRQASCLLDAVREVLEVSLGNGGTTLRDYRRATGATGRNRERLACYGRAAQPCRRCATTLRRMVIDGRTTTWCPNCQER